MWLVWTRCTRAGCYRLTRKSAAIVASKANELHGADESLDVRGLLEMESEAYRNNDAPNMASIYVRAAALSALAVKRLEARLALIIQRRHAALSSGAKP
jgi:hypothetical protein